MSFKYEICRSGEKPVAKKIAPDEVLHAFVEDDNLIIGAKELHAQFGDLSTIEHDLLTLASAVLAADRASKRGEREEFNRKISMDISLYNVAKFYPLLADFRRILRFLSKDAWTLSLRQTKVAPKWGGLDDEKCITQQEDGSVLLFSGGLDSLAAAVEFGVKEKLLLVSHITKNRITDHAQDELASKLKKKSLISDHMQIFVSSRNGGPTDVVHDHEPSQRTRSVVFMILGAIVARRSRRHKLIFMAENGQMAIHLPLSAGRIGAFSTNTAHPSILNQMTSFLSAVLGIPLQLVNPYVYETKAKVVARILAGFPEGIPISTSCWRNARVSVDDINHCGGCVPCLIRRIAIAANGEDETKYHRDLLSEDIKALGDDDDGRRNFADLADFVVRFSKLSNLELITEFPELISDYFEADKAIQMYREFSKEAKQVLSGYLHLKPFLT